MMLTNNEIKKQIELGNIQITNMHDEALDKPNSCRVYLDDRLYVNDAPFLDSKMGEVYFKEVMSGNTHYLREEKIPRNGYLLEPNHIYLARTLEKVKTNGYVPFLNGKVSLSLLGISISLNNEYKEDNFNGYFLLSIRCTKPTFIYANMEIGNLAFLESINNQKNEGMLSGKEIIRRRETGDIVILNDDNIVINPNSVNLTLNDKIAFFRDDVLDVRKENPIVESTIGENGFYLYPDEIYLGRTNEWTETYNLVPMLSGRSSLGRLGAHVHCSAGMGSIGYKGFWHLGIKTTMPLKIYPNMKCCQIYYLTPKGEITNDYQGSIQNLEYQQNDNDYYQNMSRILKRH